MGNGQWGGEELSLSLAFASELEGMVGAAVGAGGLLLVCGWAGCGSEGVDWRGGVCVCVQRAGGANLVRG